MTRYSIAACFGLLVCGGWPEVRRVESADLVYPLDIAVAEGGDVLVADRKLPGVLRIHEGEATVVAAGSQRFREPLNAVWSVAVATDGSVLVGDSATRGLYRVAAGGEPVKINTSYIGIPIRLAVDSGGRIYVSDLETQRIWRFPPAGGEAEEFAVVAGVRGLAIDAEDRVWTVRANPPQLVRYTSDGAAETIVDDGPFEFPHQLAVKADGSMAYVADGYANCVWSIAPGSEPTKWVTGDPLKGPTGLAWRGEELLVVDPRFLPY
ncbi:MAG: hypothetical protein R3B90_13125 [Planctomycetaceae bacterium]